MFVFIFITDHSSNCRGSPDRLDNKGCSPLHIAATYGNYEAIELLIEHKGNIFTLDNRGFHASKVAALNRRLDCHRLLETLYHKLTLSNPEYVKSQQTKAIKVLEKRLQKAEKAEKDGVSRNKSTSVSIDGNGKPTSRFRLSSLKKNRTQSQSTGESQTFVLKDPNKKEEQQEDNNGGQNNGDPEEESDEFDDMFEPLFKSQSAKNTLRPLPKITSGAMLQTFEGVVGSSKSHQNNRYSDTASISSDPLMNSGNRQRSRATNRMKTTGVGGMGGNLIGTLEPINPTEYELETDSPLVTFLHSVDAYETGGILLQEKMDMTSLMLCSEDDLKSIGIPLGPRKRIIEGIEKRAAVVNKPVLGGMVDTDL